MAYSKQTWHDDPTHDTPISAARLGHIEDGLETAATTADNALTLATAAVPQSGLASAIGALLTSAFPGGLTTDAELTTAISNAIAAEVTRANAAYVAGSGMAADLSAAGHRITNLLDPTSPQDAATRAYVLAQISALVNGAPALLDTLAEIAAQLATDESAVGALTTALALKAPTASPTFTGVPAAPTAAPGTSTTQLATTAFVAAQSATSQPLDSDLTTIAALDASTAGVLSTDGSGWIRKTYAQLKTALALVKADVGLGNVDNTSDVNKPVSTAQAAADAARANALTITAIKTANYSSAANELVRFDTTTGAKVLTLPAAPADKTLAGGKIVLQTGTNGLTINCSGSDTINRTGGVTTLSLSMLGEGILFEYSTSDSTLTIVARDVAPSQLDLRFLGIATAIPESQVTNLVTDLAAKVPLSTVTTKGDLLAASASGVVARLGVGSNTQVLTADSTATVGVKWATPTAGGANTFRRATGYSYQPPGFDFANHAGGNTINREQAVPFVIQGTAVITSLAVRIATGQVGGVVRLGVRSDNNGLPGTLLLDAGTVSAATSSANVSVTGLSLSVTDAVVWITTTVQSSGSTPSCVNMIPVTSLIMPVPTNIGLFSYAGFFYQDSVSGALPGSFTAAGIVSLGETPRVLVGF